MVEPLLSFTGVSPYFNLIWALENVISLRGMMGVVDYLGNERELLMIPGPTMVSPRVLRTLAKPILSHVSGEFVEGYVEALRLQKELFGTDGTPFMLSGSGTLGMEAAIANLVERGDKVLCIENGFFGEKWEEIVEAHGGVVDRIRFEWGEALDLKRIEEKLSSNIYKAFTVEHVDTSTGIANRIDKVGELAKNTDALYIVDSVCGVAGMPLKMDKWNIDYCLTGSQKAIAAPPGTSMFCLNENAWTAIDRRKTPIDNYYCNLARWKPVMENPRGYFATPATGNVLGMLEALRIIHEEGIEARWRRHEIISDAFKAGIEALGLGQFPAKDSEAHTLSVPKIPAGINDGDMRGLMRTKYGVIIAGGLGKLGGKTVRVGHMGNVTNNDIIATLSALEMSLMKLGYDMEPGSGLGTAEKILTSHKTEA
ncbi:aminotransferase [Candidatus Bathyarchaeota archaeon]|jgi:aspartate aminotransferase-like enzyme|nr:aminotransferase [Candidatus Bathyarchaeota archaeon]MDP7443229.1 alanine--glyoxylate aminotransferase family protein [Candidatus Bathyarchaeota archaeon]|tara:strand:+ start:4420 stop:5694 length:1275 start_codon:yes stop_codon:yes gene_type:complete